MSRHWICESEGSSVYGVQRQGSHVLGVEAGRCYCCALWPLLDIDTGVSPPDGCGDGRCGHWRCPVCHLMLLSSRGPELMQGQVSLRGGL